jgi:hypothetical protein
VHLQLAAREDGLLGRYPEGRRLGGRRVVEFDTVRPYHTHEYSICIHE